MRWGNILSIEFSSGTLFLGGGDLRVSLFITCYNDTLFPETGKAVVRVLERLGHTVEFPAGQTCCGQMHYNTGYQAEAMPLLERFVAQFKGAEAVVVPSSSCVAMMRDHYPKMAVAIGKTELIAEVDALLPKVFEFSEFLTKRLGLEDVGAYYPHRVTYHASCHGLRNLGLGDGPMRLLKAVRGIDLVELQGLEQCCGFGGTFAVKNADVSSAMLADKKASVLATGAEACTACDNSCLMHIQGALHREKAGVKTVHLAEILAGTWGGSVSTGALDPKTAPIFPMAAKTAMGDTQLRKNVRHATDVIQAKRARVVAEMPDWQDLREAGKQIRQHTMENLDFYLEEFEANCTRAGGVVHWARDAEEARRIVVSLVKASGSDEVIKIKSMTTEEIQLNCGARGGGNSSV